MRQEEVPVYSSCIRRKGLQERPGGQNLRIYGLPNGKTQK